MGEKREAGVVISQRELYDLVQEVMKGLQRIESRLAILEAKMADAHDADERSREALTIALEARDMAREAKHQIDWLWKTIIGALIIGAVSALFYFDKGVDHHEHPASIEKPAIVGVSAGTR